MLAWFTATIGVFLLLLPWPTQIALSRDLFIYLVPEMLLFSVAPVALGLYSRERHRLIATMQGPSTQLAAACKAAALRTTGKIGHNA